MLVDSHCHLYMKQYDGDREQVFEAARKAGVAAFVSVGIDEETNARCLELAGRMPDVYATVGWHPHSAHLVTDGLFERLEKTARSSPRVVAIGEVGLDYFKSEAPKDTQRRVFGAMIRMARATNLSLVVHSRDAFDDTLRALEEEKAAPERTVFHCFSYDAAALRRVMDYGAYVSFTCNVTFPNAAALREAVLAVPLDRFTIETDAPYLAPQAKRGQRNEPAHLNYLVEEIGKIKGVPAAEIARASSENAIRFFGLKGAGR